MTDDKIILVTIEELKKAKGFYNVASYWTEMKIEDKKQVELLELFYKNNWIKRGNTTDWNVEITREGKNIDYSKIKDNGDIIPQATKWYNGWFFRVLVGAILMFLIWMVQQNIQNKQTENPKPKTEHK